MVMAFNPDEPHDGHAAVERGFTYRMLHIAPDLLTEVLADTMGRPVGRPLFAEPVLHDPVLAGALHRLAAAISAELLARDEALDNAIRALVRRAAVTKPACPRPAPAVAGKARDLLHARYAEPVSAAELAEAAGCSRYAVHRAFLAAYGIAPSD